MDYKTLINKYFDFFKSKEHKLIPSSSLVPQNDPTILFTPAGMQPLGPYFLDEIHPKGNKIVNVQKCLRTVDFENIGDNTHHTFFQMLGNWSFGAYFKEDAIRWSYEFLTSKEWLNLPIDKLAFTVYEGDLQIPKDIESYNLWKNLGISEKRIAFLGKDNLWSLGDVGPCGPSTEMFYWTGEGDAPISFDPEDNRWVEIWNNVFMMYFKDGSSIKELSKKNVDTGMGTERVVAVLNGKKSAYETSMFEDAIKEVEYISNKSYDMHKKEMRIIVDHIRASTFILGDDNFVHPSNTDRGYVLRRLIRRAIRYGKILGIDENFTSKVASKFVNFYKEFYPELEQNKDRIYDELEKEESKFRKTLSQGISMLNKIESNSLPNTRFSGKEAFLLFQSYGFPIEMTQEILKEKGIEVDMDEYNEEYKKHQELSRLGSENMFKGGLKDTSDKSIRYHTATHILNEALRKVIDKEIVQRGSNITPERLRFDFKFDRKLTIEEIKKIEDEVNLVIQKGFDVSVKEMPLQEALKSGAQQEFAVKYPDTVKVYFIGDYSKELCGGPHVKNTKELGVFKIIKEESSSFGVRRIKAVLE